MENDRTVPMFKTNIETIEAGPFAGPMVVSMRAIPIKKLEMVFHFSKFSNGTWCASALGRPLRNWHCRSERTRLGRSITRW